VLDYAEAMTLTPVEVPDELFAALRQHFNEAQLVELTAAIAWENHRGRFNHAFGIEAQGFSKGAYCPLRSGLVRYPSPCSRPRNSVAFLCETWAVPELYERPVAGENETRSLMFSEKEIAYLKSQRLGRIATASKKSQPDVAPVGFDFDGTYFYVGGVNFPKT
jgi:hypothetical protein